MKTSGMLRPEANVQATFTKKGDRGLTPVKKKMQMSTRKCENKKQQSQETTEVNEKG